MKVKFLLMSKQETTKDGRKFRKYWTSMDIVVKGQEDKGQQLKSLTVKFGQDVETKNFVRGIITAEEKDVHVPYKWEITKKIDKNGVEKEHYPVVYVDRIISYDARQPKSTGTFNLRDEEDELESTEIEETI